MKTESVKPVCSTIQDYSLNTVLWFPRGTRREVELNVSTLLAKGVNSIRVGINCEAFNTQKGSIWYDWLMSILIKKFEIELCFDKFSPPLTAKKNKQRYSLAEIVEIFIYKYGEQFECLELWRNPRDKYIPITSSTNIFSDELVFAACWAVNLDKKVKIGGIQAGDFEWLSMLVHSRFLEKIEAIRLDSEGDLWSTTTQFFARTLRSILKENGLKTVVLSCPTSLKIESA